MKKLLLIAVGAMTLFAACKKDNDDVDTSKARVMFVNGALDADSLKARINNTDIRTIAFLGNTGYVNVDPASNATIDFAYTGSGSVFSSVTGNLAANNSYSIFAGGNANNKVIISRNDDLSAPANGKAKVRFALLSPGAPNAIAYVNSTTVDSNVAFGTVTDFKEVNAGSATITVVAQSSVATLTGFTLSSGKIYTFMFTGTLSGTGNNALKLTAINNN